MLKTWKSHCIKIFHRTYCSKFLVNVINLSFKLITVGPATQTGNGFLDFVCLMASLLISFCCC